MNLEAVVHRIGGPDNSGPRLFGPWMRPISLDSRERVELPARDSSRWWITLWLSDWHSIGPDWKAGQLEIEAMDGSILGRRPMQVYAKPYDVPTYCSVMVPRDDVGLLSVGLRVFS